MRLDNPKDGEILSISDIKKFKTLGAAGLDDSGNTTYLLKFMFNDKKNQAADPIPFRIATEALDKIADSAIGRPYVHNPGIKNNVGEHVRGPDDDPKKIVEFQKKYAIGMIEGKYRTTSNNVYAIISAFPEYENDIKTGTIPKPTSPLLEPINMVGDTIYDANMLHLQAVPVSGYPMELTSQLGVCKGMLDKCATELRTLGSSGKLKEFQNKFSYSSKSLGSSEMPEDQSSGPDGSGQMSVDDMVKNHDKMLADHGKMLEDHGKSLGAIGEQLGQVLKNTSNSPGSNYGKPDSAGSRGTYGSAGEQQMVEVPKQVLETLESELKSIKTTYETEKAEMAKEKQKMMLKERETMARTIAQGEVYIKEITPDKFEERVKYYVGLTNPDNKQLVDISLLAAKFSKFSKTVGSAGAIDYSERFPSLESTLGAAGEKKQPSLSEIMESMN